MTTTLIQTQRSQCEWKLDGKSLGIFTLIQCMWDDTYPMSDGRSGPSRSHYGTSGKLNPALKGQIARKTAVE